VLLVSTIARWLAVKPKFKRLGQGYVFLCILILLLCVSCNFVSACQCWESCQAPAKLQDITLAVFQPFLPRDSMLVRCMLLLSIWPSATSQHCTKTAKHRITQKTPHDWPGTPVFWYATSRWNSNLSGASNRGGGGYSQRFSTSVTLYVKNVPDRDRVVSIER